MVHVVAEIESHNEAIRVFYEYTNVENTILWHIQTAVEEIYINYLVDEDTYLIEEDITTVLAYWFTNYGKVTSDEVIEKNSKY